MWLEVLVVATLLFLCVAVIVTWCNQRQRSAVEQINQLEKQLEYNVQQQQQYQHEIAELRTGLIGVGQRVLQLETNLNELSSDIGQAVQQLSEKQQAMELTEPESKIYTRAMKMVQLGADLDEIMRECELPRAEAELLFNLHQQKKSS